MKESAHNRPLLSEWNSAFFFEALLSCLQVCVCVRVCLYIHVWMILWFAFPVPLLLLNLKWVHSETLWCLHVSFHRIQKGTGITQQEGQLLQCKWLKTMWTSLLFPADHPADMETLGQTGEGDLFLYLGLKFWFSKKLKEIKRRSWTAE